MKYYSKSERVLQEFGDHPSFSGIRTDCQNIVQILKVNLWSQFKETEVSPFLSHSWVEFQLSPIFLQVTSPELKESVTLLCALGESSSLLAEEYLTHNRLRLESDLEQLAAHESTATENGEKVLYFIDACCNSVLNNVALTIATFNNIFAPAPGNGNKEIVAMAAKIINDLCPVVERKTIELIGSDVSENSCVTIVAALDKFHRRLLAVQRLLLSEEQWSSVVIASVTKTVADQSARILEETWIQQLQQWKESWTDKDQPHDSVKQLETSLVEPIQRAFVALQV